MVDDGSQQVIPGQTRRRALVAAALLVGAAVTGWLWSQAEVSAWSEQQSGLLGSHEARTSAGEGEDGSSSEGPAWLTPPAAPKKGAPLPEVSAKPSTLWPTLARVRTRTLSISHSTGAPLYHIGELRLGALVRVRPLAQASNSGCKGGWLELEPRGIVCPQEGLALGKTPPAAEVRLPAPDPRNVIPHRYVKVATRDAYRFDVVPDPESLQEVLQGDAATMAEVGAHPLDGAYFLAIDEELRRHGKRWLKTNEGNFVRAAVTEPIKPPKLVGVRIEDVEELPLAFVVQPNTPARSAEDGHVVGHAARYARVPLAGSGEPNAEGLVKTEDGYLLPAESLRIVRSKPRPSAIPEEARWLQVNHTTQTLLAYDGDEPIYATLVSSGKPGRRTPTGVHRVEYKHLTITMRGEDKTGPYEVQEVPWVLYYDGPYAVHGAYWHDAFGATRSHGCTNLAPADARYLFSFMRPQLPAGWHTSTEAGSYVHMTRGS